MERASYDIGDVKITRGGNGLAINESDIRTVDTLERFFDYTSLGPDHGLDGSQLGKSTRFMQLDAHLILSLTRFLLRMSGSHRRYSRKRDAHAV
jgi:hypothetical protein